jgi:hypothetical protein
VNESGGIGTSTDAGLIMTLMDKVLPVAEGPAAETADQKIRETDLMGRRVMRDHRSISNEC